jgi:hypothetical protein
VQEQLVERGVNPIWKTATLILATAIVAGLPSYFSLLWDRHTAVSLVDVDREITIQNAATIQKIDDLAVVVGNLSDVTNKLRDQINEGQLRRH